MKITINIVEPIKKVQEFQEYDLGQITTTLQDLLDNSSIIVDSNIIPILKVLSIDNIVKKYLIKNLTENVYNTSNYITGQDLTENDLLLITGDNQNSGITVNTAFVNKAYLATMTVAYDAINPNFEIDVTGNLDLTVTGTVNGDSGLVNLYFSATEVATLNGLTSLIITGAGDMIAVGYVHDLNGLRWYSEINTALFSLKKGTKLYHTAIATDEGTFTNVGNECIGTGTVITNDLVGALITKANGETAIIETINAGLQTFTTETSFLTDSVDVNFEINALAFSIDNNGTISQFEKNGVLYSSINANGSGNYKTINMDANGNCTFTGFVNSFGLLSIAENNLKLPPFGAVISSAGGNEANDIGLRRYTAGIWEINNGTAEELADLMLKNIMLNPETTYTDDAQADADVALLSGSLYFITGDRIPRKKP